MNGINNDGEVIGYGYDSSLIGHSYLYSGGTYTEILPPGWINVDVQSPFNKINNNGEVIGGGIDSSGNYKGFLYSKGTYTELIPPEWSLSSGCLWNQ